MKISSVLLLCAMAGLAQADEMMTLQMKGGTTAVETKRSEALSELKVNYDAGLQESATSRGMFMMYVACQVAKHRGFSHFILLARESDGPEADELVVGVSSDAADTISAKKWKKYKGDYPLQELYSYDEMCQGMERIYGSQRVVTETVTE